MSAMSWIDTKTDEEARALDRGMWEIVGSEQPDGRFVAQAAGPAPENGEFWYDALNRIKDDPDQRYSLARRHLPLPAAWREMAVSLRMKIRKTRKEKVGYEDHLRELHHLASMSSYAGYGYIQRVPYARLSSLDLSYDRMGCDRLDLLGATDRKWMREQWGEPEDHSTAAELYEDMLAADIQRIKAEEEQERVERMEKLFGNLYREIEEESAAAPAPPPQKRRGLFGWLFRR
ncbi:hypothetical protein GOC00_08495 [Sinorhizobium meliloti]|nr:hypothetical protein [Sinorhizobium meliloti]MDX0000556.1 hypothetical protein [Sinorhizobium meliloti]MDX0075279.1 hypothetical protein [Sinorhizobium meliloti]MDX0210179.1 hypothetical protein [Sinorhizobium meliloti]MDX0353818.1 hypothetical protein [Sinorhizobium meliloti]